MSRVLLNTQLATAGVSATGRYVRALVRYLPITPDLQVTCFDYAWRRLPFVWRLGKSTKARGLVWPLPGRVGDWLFRRCHLLRAGYFRTAYDLLHLPDDTFIRAKARNTVATLHMAPPLQRPDFFSPDYCEYVYGWLRRARDQYDMLITVSEHLRQLVISDYGFAADRVTAVPLGIEEDFLQAKRRPTRPQLLYVGWIRKAKNVPAVCNVFRRLLRAHPDLELVLVGKLDVSLAEFHGWLKDDPVAISRTRLVGQIPLDDVIRLRSYYENASVLLFPSYAEGWTSPPLEAMASGLPVVTSNVSSLPETVGAAAVTVDPEDHDAMAEAVDRFLTDEAFRDEYVERGRARAARFTWQEMARKTAQVYANLCS